MSSIKSYLIMGMILASLICTVECCVDESETPKTINDIRLALEAQARKIDRLLSQIAEIKENVEYIEYKVRWLI